MLRRTITILPVFLLLTGLTSTAMAAYKWVDKDGNVHFSQLPPPDQDSTYIGTGSSYPAETENGTEGEAASGESPGPASATKPASPPPDTGNLTDEQFQAAINARNRKNCEIARDNLAQLTQKGRLNIKDEQGNLVPLSDEAKQQRIERAQQQVQQFCR